MAEYKSSINPSESAEPAGETGGTPQTPSPAPKKKGGAFRYVLTAVVILTIVAVAGLGIQGGWFKGMLQPFQPTEPPQLMLVELLDRTDNFGLAPGFFDPLYGANNSSANHDVLAFRVIAGPGTTAGYSDLKSVTLSAEGCDVLPQGANLHEYRITGPQQSQYFQVATDVNSDSNLDETEFNQNLRFNKYDSKIFKVVLNTTTCQSGDTLTVKVDGISWLDSDGTANNSGIATLFLNTTGPVLDEQGNPVLDANGQPVYDQTITFL